MILGSELGVKKVRTAVSEHLGILPKIREGAIVLRFGSKQPLKKQPLSSWFIGTACSLVVL